MPRMRNHHAVKGLLLDLDGVLYVGDTVIPGAIEAIAALRQTQFPMRFITNTTTQPRTDIHRKLTGMGFALDEKEIFTAPQAAVFALRRMGNPRCALVVDERIRSEFAEFSEDHNFPDVVIVGDIGNRWSYELLNKIFNLVRKGAHLVGLHKNRFWQTAEGLQMDIGAFVSGIEYATGKRATIMGKPSRAFFDIALHDMRLAAHEAAIVGDDIDSDIGGGQEAGLKGILVTTGKYREEYTQQSAIKPDIMLHTVADLPRSLGG